ncbi:protein FAM200C-like [Palaemon carinicauda]|uniref:protein FAM200C-like n=1 Tax=Palaemon carinicauda TaxID=392227 RepID=UPI0035B60993
MNVKYSFTALLDDKGGPDRPQCMTFHFIICNLNLKSARLQDHQLKHPTTEHEQSLEALQVKRARYEKKGKLPQLGFKPVQKHFLQVSYEVAYQCIRAKASHSAPENWIKPCIIRMVELILGTETAKKMKDVPLSNNVIGGRVENMSCVIFDQIVEESPASPTRINLQLDESTDVSNLSQLIVYTHYFKDGEIKDEFLFCLALQTTTKTADVFRLLDEFFQKHQIKWEKVGSLCTDGAPAMMGNKSGFAAPVKETVPDIITNHCVLHHNALAVKTLPSHLKEVLSICVKVVNYIWGRALNHKVFKLFCEEMGGEHQVLLFHTEVRWVSRGKMLTQWIQQPFLADMDNDDNLNEELIHLQVNQGCQTKFRTLPLSGFWCDELVVYPGLVKAALEMIIPFPTTYFCEKVFSIMLQIKTTLPRTDFKLGCFMI